MKRNPEQRRLYRIYKIECNINALTDKTDNQFYPIYIGCTCQALKRRFSGHIHGKRTMHKYIKKYGKEHFRIIEITTIYTNELEAHKIENQIALKYAKKYKLVSKKNGDKYTEELKKNLSLKRSKKKIKVGEQIYNSVKEASKELKIPRSTLYWLLIGKTKECHSYILKSIEDNVYILEKIDKSTKNERISKANQLKVKFTLIEENLTFLSIKELAEYFNVSRNTIQSFIKNKTICKHKKINKTIQHEDYTEYILEDNDIYIFNMNTKDVSTSAYETANLVVPGINKNSIHIHECCRNIKRSLRGNHFRCLTKGEIRLYKQNENNRFKFDCSDLYKILYKEYILNIDLNIVYTTSMAAVRSIQSDAITSQRINNCCEGKAKSTGGYHWRYLTIEEIENYINKNRVN